MNRLSAALETSRLLPKSWCYPAQVDSSKLSKKTKLVLKRFEELDIEGRTLPASLMSERVHQFHYDFEKTVAMLMETLTDEASKRNDAQLLAFALHNPYCGGYRVLMKVVHFQSKLLLQSPGYWPKGADYPGDRRYKQEMDRSVRVRSAIEGGTRLEITLSSESSSRSSELDLDGIDESPETLPEMSDLSIVTGFQAQNDEEPGTSGLTPFSRNGSVRKSDKRKREQGESTAAKPSKKQKKKENLQVTTFFDDDKDTSGDSEDFNDTKFDDLVEISSDEQKVVKKKKTSLPRPKMLSKIVRPKKDGKKKNKK